MRPKFRYSDLNTLSITKKDFREWEKENNLKKEWLTPEGIPVKSVYTKEDLEGMEHLNYAAGLPPFLRGPYSGMYAMLPWTIRQYAGFSTAEESNAFYRRNLAAGQKGLSVAFDLATHRGYDSDHERVAGDVGNAGVAVDSILDMKLLFDQIPLNKMSESMTMNGAVLPVMAFYIVAALGHTQSLHTNALDEAMALPTDFSARIARNTQIYIQEETQICRAIDPWAGSYYVETLTHEIAQRAWEHIMEIESLGGMAKAVESGVPKMRIEEAAARAQAKIDSGVQTIVGTNKYRLEKEDPLETLEVDNSAVRESQIKRLAKLRAERNESECQIALDAITKCVQTGEGNLLELAVEAAAKRASLGEISYACEKIVGRYKAVIRTISGVYSSENKSDNDFNEARALVARFAEKEGRQPRIMIAKMGQDGHDRGAKVVSTGYADIGFDVDIGPLFQTPAEAAKQILEILLLLIK